MAKNSKIRQSVTLFFFQTAFFWVLSIVAKNLKIRQIRHFLTTLLLENCFVYIFAESRDSLSLRESAVRPRKTERISRQNVAAEFWKVRKSLSWKQDSARFQEFTKLLNVGTFAFCWPTGLKFIKKTEGKLKEGNNQKVKLCHNIIQRIFMPVKLKLF